MIWEKSVVVGGNEFICYQLMNSSIHTPHSSLIFMTNFFFLWELADCWKNLEFLSPLTRHSFRASLLQYFWLNNNSFSHCLRRRFNQELNLWLYGLATSLSSTYSNFWAFLDSLSYKLPIWCLAHSLSCHLTFFNFLVNVCIFVPLVLCSPSFWDQ